MMQDEVVIPIAGDLGRIGDVLTVMLEMKQKRPIVFEQLIQTMSFGHSSILQQRKINSSEKTESGANHFNLYVKNLHD